KGNESGKRRENDPPRPERQERGDPPAVACQPEKCQRRNDESEIAPPEDRRDTPVPRSLCRTRCSANHSIVRRKPSSRVTVGRQFRTSLALRYEMRFDRRSPAREGPYFGAGTSDGRARLCTSELHKARIRSAS